MDTRDSTTIKSHRLYTTYFQSVHTTHSPSTSLRGSQFNPTHPVVVWACSLFLPQPTQTYSSFDHQRAPVEFTSCGFSLCSRKKKNTKKHLECASGTWYCAPCASRSRRTASLVNLQTPETSSRIPTFVSQFPHLPYPMRFLRLTYCNVCLPLRELPGAEMSLCSNGPCTRLFKYVAGDIQHVSYVVHEGCADRGPIQALPSGPFPFGLPSLPLAPGKDTVGRQRVPETSCRRREGEGAGTRPPLCTQANPDGSWVQCAPAAPVGLLLPGHLLL